MPATRWIARMVNHSHVVDNSDVNTGAIRWEVRAVLINDPRDWPTRDGKSGITSVSAMDGRPCPGCRECDACRRPPGSAMLTLAVGSGELPELGELSVARDGRGIFAAARRGLVVRAPRSPTRASAAASAS